MSSLNRSELRRRLSVSEVLFALPALLLFVLYFHGVGILSGSEWSALARCGIVSSVLVAAALLLQQRKAYPVFLEFAEREAAGDEIPEPLARSAFALAMRHPFEFTVMRTLAWAVSFVCIALGMYAQGHDSWLLGERLVMLSTFSVGSLGIASIFAYFIGRSAIEPVRVATARCVPDAAARRELTSRTTLGRKLQAVMTGTGVSVVVFTLGIAWQVQILSVGRQAAHWNHEALSMLSEAMPARAVASAPDFDFAALVRDTLPPVALRPYPVEFSLHDEASLRSLGGIDPLTLEEMLSPARPASATREIDSDDLVNWKRGEDGRILTARTRADQLLAPYQAQRRLLAIAALLSFGFGGWVAQLLAREVRGSLTAMCEAADAIANGDLRPRALLESEDEMGDLAHAFERMRASLRETLAGVAQAADNVEAMSGELHAVSADVAQVNVGQATRIAEVNALMESISRKAGAASDSAGNLGESVEDSSSSVIELGAAGEQLNATASVLSGKVEEVSDSIEQMVRSVRQVGESTGDLAEAAADTSSSMEEMASAMKAVDVTAAKTAELSSNVLERSERGRMRVRETIEGMDAIREATDAAERVIRGLGSRTEQIGAILDVIDDVGDETSLLALNAAIIAAQAGEQGRAFSVVAEEIKELADRVLASTKEIASVVRAVQDEAANAVGAIEAGSQQVARGVDLSAEAGLSLEEITRAAGESGDRIQEIVRAVREQTHAASHVASLMDRVRSGVEEIRSAGAEQNRANEVVFQSSVTMREVAQQVRRTTEEQSRGFVRIRDSVETVRDTVEVMGTGLREQEQACAQVLHFLAQVREGTASNENSAQRMDASMRTLREQAEALREGVARFEI